MHFQNWFGILLGLCLPLSITLGQGVKLHDDRLRLTLFAEAPDIVTPIGVAVDGQDRVYVVESHTHHPPKDYPGPESDRIKIFVDDDGDGKADRNWVFAEGLDQAMNLAFSPQGDLFVVCAREVIRILDTDQNGIADEQHRVLWLDTRERYAHNSLLGITFDANGKLYVARGNTGSRHYALRGSDGSFVEGYGDGGSVVRSNADGTEVEEFATGFWNPFDLKFMSSGELFLVDNDPDARGPNRLCKVVEAGDYGYKSLYGGGGNHPFQGWDGELPGTLPYIAGTGEAPSGLIDLRRTSFPRDYRHSVLATIWNENSIERFDVIRSEDGISAEKSRWVSGPKDFRPVAMECDRSGNLFITDWVLVDYPNHGQGRIWRVSCTDEVQNRLKPLAYFDRHEARPPTSSSPANLPLSLISKDPFERHAAITRLSEDGNSEEWLRAKNSDVPQMRLAALLASRKRKPMEADEISDFLADPDERVALGAVMIAGESFNPDLRDAIDVILDRTSLSPKLFEAWLAAARNLHPDFSDAVRSRTEDKSNQIMSENSDELLYRLAQNSELDSELRAMALSRLSPTAIKQHTLRLAEQLRSADEIFSAAIMRALTKHGGTGTQNQLAEFCHDIAEDSQASLALRLTAVESLSQLPACDPVRLAALVENDSPDIALAAADGLGNQAGSAVPRELIEELLQRDLAATLRESLSYAQFGTDATKNPYVHNRPSSPEAWQVALAESGDPRRGQRVFESQRVGCVKCHSLNGIRALLGPDLGRVAASKSRRQIIESVLDPSADFPPQYQAWLVVTEDGHIHRGLQLDHKAAGAIELLSETGESIRFEGDEVVDYRASPKSLMPEGLEQTMSVSEFRDLIEFLCTQN